MTQPAATPTPTTTPSAVTKTVNVNLTIGGKTLTVPTTESGASSLLAALEAAKLTSS